MHTHVVPERFPPAGTRASASRWPHLDHFEPGRAKVLIAGQNFRTITDQCWSHARRSGDLAREGVDAQVLSPMPELLSYWFTPEDGLELSRYVNETIANLVQSSPSQYHGLGMVPLQEPDLAANELSEVKRMGLRGIELGSNINGLSLGDPCFLPFLQEAERQGLAIFVHALHPTMTERIGPLEPLVNSIGFPTDTGLTIAALITAKVIEQCPNLRLAFSHGGGTFPFILPRLEHAWSAKWNGEPPDDPPPAFGSALRELLPQPPTEYARTLYYDTLVFDRRAIRYLREMMGSTQLLVGTDYPFMPREQPVGKTLQSMGLTEDELEAITWQNCLRFLGVQNLDSDRANG